MLGDVGSYDIERSVDPSIAPPIAARGGSEAPVADRSPSDEMLLAAARAAGRQAHAPYSGWHVGAAALFVETGPTIHRGANVENGSFGLTICAERSAVFAGVVAGGRQLARIAIACTDGSGATVGGIVPCGACLQVIAEFATPDTGVVIDGGGAFRLSDFLPRPFGAAALACHGPPRQ